MKMVKSLVVTLMLLMAVLVTGCGQVFSDVHIDKDLGGTWKTKIFANQPMTKEQLENRLSQSNIMKYTIDPIAEELTVDGVKKTSTVGKFLQLGRVNKNLQISLMQLVMG